MRRILAVWWLAVSALRGPGPRPPLVQLRRLQAVRTPLSLELAYYPARRERAVELIPKDAYMTAVEALLEATSR